MWQVPFPFQALRQIAEFSPGRRDRGNGRWCGRAAGLWGGGVQAKEVAADELREDAAARFAAELFHFFAS